MKISGGGKRAWMEVDLGVVRENVRCVKAFTGARYLACVKADGYGMGAVAVSRAIAPLVDYFGVATVDEGIELRAAGIRQPVLVLGAVLPGWVSDAVRNDLTLNVFTRPVLNAVERAAGKSGRKAAVHVKVDTGMGRVGVRPEEAPDFIAEVAAASGVRLTGVFSHLATAEWRDRKYARAQIRRFEEMLKASPAGRRSVTHIANSAAVLNLPETYRRFHLVRPGLLSLGVYPELRLRPRLRLDCALTGYARVLFVKDVPAGTRLSYGITHVTKRKKTRLATLGIGYADGLRRALSNRFSVLIGGREAPIVGNVCMDQTLVDVTGIEVREGDLAQVTGPGASIEAMAAASGAIPHEVLCGFGSRRMEKVYKRDAKSEVRSAQ